MPTSQKRNLFLIGIFIAIFLLKWFEMQKWNEAHLNSLIASTADSFYWLKEAQQLKLETPKSTNSLFQKQLLPTLISKIAQNPSVSELKRAGNLLIPVSLSLSGIAIALVASAGAFSLTYLLVGLFSVFTPAIFARSYAGYIDTDMLNLFFLFSICQCIYLIFSLKKLKDKLIVSGLAGALNLVFYFWYHHALFTLLFIGAMTAAFFYKKTKWQEALKVSFVFLIISAPSTVESIQIVVAKINSYTSPSLTSSQEQIGAATRYQLVTELQKVSFLDLPPLIYDLNIDPISGIFLLLVSFLGLFLWLKEDLLKIFCFAPLLIFLPLTLKSGIRFTFYSLPLFWIGLASAFLFLENKVLKKYKIKNPTLLPLSFFVFGCFLCLRQLTCINSESACYKDLMTLNFPSKEWLNVVPFFEKEKISKNDVILAWWDSGYFIELATPARVVHNNQTSGNELTNFYAEALMKTKQSESRNLFQAIANPNALSCANSNEDCLLKIPKSTLSQRIFLIIDIGNLQKLPVSSLLSPSSKGRDPSILENFYSESACKNENNQLRCDGLPINLETGKVNNKFQLSAYLKTDDQKIIQFKVYDKNETNILVETIKNDGSYYAYVKNQYFYSTAGQLWFGFSDKSQFKEVYNDQHFLKVFEIIP